MMDNKATVTVYAENCDEACEQATKALTKYFPRGHRVVAMTAEGKASETGYVTRWTVHITAESTPPGKRDRT